jgi:hypothetical protein
MALHIQPVTMLASQSSYFRSALDAQIVGVHLQAMRGERTAEVGSHL